MSGIEGSMVPDDMKLSAIKVGIGLLVVAVVLFSAWLFFRYKRRKQLKPLDPLKVIDLEPKPESPDLEPKPQDAAPKAQDAAPESPDPTLEIQDPKPEDPKPEAPKPEAPKPKTPHRDPEAPKPEAPKPKTPHRDPEAPKPEAPKPEAPKPEAPKPKTPKPKTPHRKPKTPDPAPKKISVSSMMRGVDVTAEECHDASAPIPQGPHIFVVPVTQAMLDSGAYTSDGSSGWLMQHAGLVGQRLAVTAAGLAGGRVVHRDVLPGGAGQPKVSALRLLYDSVVHRGVLPGGDGKPKVSALHLLSPRLALLSKGSREITNTLYFIFLRLFRATAEAKLDPGATLVVPLIDYENSSMTSEAYREVFVQAFTEAASTVTRGCRQSLVSFLGVARVEIHHPNGPECGCMASHFQLLCTRAEEVLKHQPRLEVVSAIDLVCEAVCAEIAAPAPTGELDDSSLEGAGLDSGRGSP